MEACRPLKRGYEAETFFIEDAANSPRNALPEVRVLFLEVSKLSRLLIVSPASRYKA